MIPDPDDGRGCGLAHVADLMGAEDLVRSEHLSKYRAFRFLSRHLGGDLGDVLGPGKNAEKFYSFVN